MPMLIVNGIKVPCEVTSGKRSTEQLGESPRAIDGTLRIHRRVLKQGAGFKFTLQVPEVAECFRRLILGEGHSWNFDDATTGLYSGKGLGPSTSSGAALNAGAAWRGARGLRLTATTGTISFVALPVAPPVTAWTVMLARNTGSGWTHYIATSAGKLWTNGVGSVASMPGLTVTGSTGTVKIDAAGTTTDVDELAILPYAIPDYAVMPAGEDWGAQIFDHLGTNGQQWKRLARLGVAGDAFFPLCGLTTAGPAIECAGEVKDGGFTWGTYRPSFGQQALKDFDFTLREV